MRLVAESFIPNVNNYPCVNHKNGIKTDNRVENLEWCSYSENQIHSYKIETRKKTKQNGVCKNVIDVVTKKEYHSLTEASKELGIKRGYLSLMLTEKCKNKTNLKYV